MTRVLGLDIGISSIGFALVDFDKKEIPVIGVHCFDKAEEPKTGASLALPRRLKRSARRRLRRRNQRLRQIKSLCMHHGLLDLEQIDFLKDCHNEKENPWRLRHEGLSRVLSGPEFARALLHIAKRRGFKSSKKEDREVSRKESSEAKSLGEMKRGVEGLLRGWEANKDKYPTIGSYLCHQPTQRNRRGVYDRVILRKAHEEEVYLLFSKQRELGSELATEKFEAEYRSWAFWQRPLRSFEDMVGWCELEGRLGNKEKRAPRAAPTAELFNLYQTLIDLRYDNLDGSTRRLTREEREQVIGLARTKEIKYADIRQILELDESWRPNLLVVQAKQQDKTIKELEKAKFRSQLKGYRELKKAVCDADEDYWLEIAENAELLDEIARVLSVTKDEAEQEDLFRSQGIPDNVIEALLGLSFDKFHSYSLVGMRKLISFMQEGKTLSDAIELAGYNVKAPLSLSRRTQLPPFAATTNPVLYREFSEEGRGAVTATTNPIVNRALAETRKVVNAIIRKAGLPDRIHVELARDLSRNFQERKDITKENKQREGERDSARAHLEEILGRQARPGELSRYLLAEQQQWRCLYSGRAIEPQMLADDSLLQVDHIIPYSLCFDNSMSNRVLVFAQENQRKGQRLPWQYLSSDPERLAQFEANVNSLGNDFVSRRKKANLLRKDFGEQSQQEWKNRALNDTRYIAKLVAQHLQEHLDLGEPGQQCVRTRKGGLTALLRRSWGLIKDREESDKHHALDAVVIACAEDRVAQEVEWREKRRESGAMRRELQVPVPWGENEEFRQLVLEKVNGVFVSRRQQATVTGEAHQETVRSERTNGDGRGVVTQRMLLEKVELKTLEKLYQKERNKKLYNLLRERLLRFDNKPDKAFGAGTDPIIIGYSRQDGQPRIVKAVTVATTEKSGVYVGGQGESRKGFASNGSMIRVDVFRKDGKYYLVPIYVSDVARGVLPMVAAGSDGEDLSPEATFVFSLTKNDYVVTENSKGEVKEGYYRGCDVSDGRVKIVSHAGENEGVRVSTGLLKRFEKYRIDYFGNRYRILKEKRRVLANTCHHQERSSQVQGQTASMGG